MFKFDVIKINSLLIFSFFATNLGPLIRVSSNTQQPQTPN